MPANLSPEFKLAEQKFRSATTPEQKLSALEEMLSNIPKHKGTEKMQGDLKRRISKLRSAQQKKSVTARQRPVYIVDREGAAQIALVGPPNSGKSSLLKILTGAEPEIADYPFSSRMPLPGMASHHNVQLQLVDLPPIAEEGSPPWLGNAIKMADAIALIVDSGSDDVLTELEDSIVLLGRYGITPGMATTSDRKQMITVVVAAKKDLDPGGERLDLIREVAGDLPVIAVSALEQETADPLVSSLYESLGLVRIYTKAPGKKPDYSAPYVLRRGATVVDAARAVHKDIAANLKSARLWNETTDGLLVARDYELEDGDTIEFRN